MNMKRLIPCLLLTGTLLLGSCENGLMTDMEGQGTELPDGKYPLDFTAVQTAPEGTPQTRVSENTDGMSSKWDGGEVINVQIAGGSPGTYTLDENGKPTAETPCYWQNTQPATINAWYSNITGQSTETDAGKTVSLSGQSNRLAYVLKATASDVNYKSPNIELEFHHQLAKVRVKLEGQQAGKVESVWVNNYTSCTVTNGDVSADNKDKNYIQMRKNDGYYEANLVPMQAITAGDFIRLNDDTKAAVSGITQLEAGKVYTITINVKSAVVPLDLSTLTDDYIVKSDMQLSGTTTRKITIAADASVILSGVTINKNYLVCEGNATIQLADGTTNTITVPSGEWKDGTSAGVQVGPSGTTTTITGSGRLEINDVQYATCIGNSYNGNCGDIVINGGTIVCTVKNNQYGTAIGAFYGTCGNITINGGDVTANGGWFGVGIGSGGQNLGSGICGSITISGGIVKATGGYGSGIGTFLGSCGNILIDGGTVTAKGEDEGASGIGTSCAMTQTPVICGTITIKGNETNVTANKGSEGYRDIGKGMIFHTCGKVTIGDGATVNGTKYTETAESEDGFDF